MKRSRSLRLVLMGGAALSLSACEEPVEVGVYQTVQQCTVMGYSQSACETAIATAQREHVQTAPRYATRAACEAEFGNCESAPAAAAGADTPPGQAPGSEQAAASSGGSFFMPLLAGYMMGNLMSGRGYAAQPLYRPVGAAAAAGGGFYTGGGAKVAATTGLARVPQSAFSSTRATTLSRGGFGARARSFSVSS